MFAPPFFSISFNYMELYVFENYKLIYPELKDKALTNRLILCSLEEYGIMDGIIERTEEGKPYISNHRNTFISVSHSGDYFVCLVGDKPLGVDIQEARRTNKDKIAQRYFTEGEIQYMNEKGEDGFFYIWTRKEAYAKYRGTGLKEVLAKTCVLDRTDVEFDDFQLERGLYGSWCTE